MEGQIIHCRNCGQANRLPSLESGKKAVCGKCGAPLEGGTGAGAHPVELRDANFAQSIITGKYVVDFWASWCGPCRMIAPVIEQLASERKDIHFAKLNVDENPETSAFFKVQSIPLLVFFKDGEERGRLVGSVPRQNIETAISQFLG